MADAVSGVEDLLRSELRGDPPAVGGPMADLVAAGGKRLRPALVLLTAMLGDYRLDRLLPAALAVELTHAATLIHDDVIDQAATRRGRPTVAASLGTERAIVIGDYYLVKAYELAARTKESEVVSILARAVMRICAGEVQQQSLRFRYTLEEDAYFEWISAKTAALMAASCEIGGLLGGLGEEAQAAIVQFGSWLGMAFQVADDVLDYRGTEDEVGKPIGHDLVEGFATLPFMLAVQRGAVPQIEDGRRLTEEEARRVAEQVRASDAPRIAIERARQFASQAREQLSVLEDSEASTTLASLTEYVVSRTF